MYGHIVVIAAKQHLDGKRTSMSTFESSLSLIMVKSPLVRSVSQRGWCTNIGLNDGYQVADLVRKEQIQDGCPSCFSSRYG